MFTLLTKTLDQTSYLLARIKTPAVAQATEQATSSAKDKIIGFFMWLLEKTPVVFGAIAIIFITFIFGKIVKRTVVKALSKHNADDQVVLMVGKVSHIGTMILGFTIALELVGVDISPVVGLIGLGFGFALQDIIKNFVCGGIILLQEPFRIGDVIKVGEYLGKVEAIEARSTNIKTFNGQRVIIPNADMFSSSVTNFSSHPERRLEIVVGVHYDTDLNTASKILMETVKKHNGVLANPSPSVIHKEFADSSINISVKFWVDKDSNIFGIRSEIIVLIKEAFDEAHISIPYPIRTVDMPTQDVKDELDKEIFDRTSKGEESIQKVETGTDPMNKQPSVNPFSHTENPENIIENS